MEALVRISHGLDGLITRVGKFAAWASLGMIVVTVFDVLTRNFSQSEWQFLRDLVAHQQSFFGSTKLQELEWHLHTILFALCLGYAYMRDTHVRIDLVRERLPVRVRWWVELIGVIFFLMPICALIVWFSVDFAISSYNQHEISSSATGLSHRWIIKSVIPIGFVLLFIAGIATLLRKIVELFASPELRAKVGSEEEAEAAHLEMIDDV
jgi:TRAP-type mannitol/chloroaromatic compound transport system permease small subunit